MPVTLIQLISEQTVQNLLPVMRVKPERLIHLVTPRTREQAASVARAIHLLGFEPEIEVVGLSDMPDIEETYHQVRRCGETALQGEDTVVVNFTGGTKLMGIGAFGAATELRAPALYVDSQQCRFVPGDQQGRLKEFLGNQLGFGGLTDQLRVDILAVANGMKRVTQGLDWRPCVPLARRLFSDADLERAVHEAFHGPQGLCPGGVEPRTPQDWLTLARTPIALPDELLPPAEAFGLVSRSDQGPVLALSEEGRAGLEELATGDARIGPRYFALIRPLQHQLAMLTGAWWEVIVCEAMERSGRFRDLRWSVQVGTPHGADQEEDLLAVEGVQLVFVSCKRSSSRGRLVPLMEEIRSRAATIGGRFNRRILAVRHRPGPGTLRNMQENAARLGIELVFGDQIDASF